ncbi:MAG: sensor domain-containing protein [Thermoanaerobaculia bacterium]
MTLESEHDALSFPGALAHFFGAPIRLRTYTNLLFLALAFPLGLIYFIFLTVGLAVGYGLVVIWVGIPILALVFAGSWGMSAMERRLAIGLLGAEVPPMAPPPSAQAVSVWQRVKAFLSNPVTWKGMAYLLVKFPLGVVSFVALVTSVSVSVALMLVPVLWPFADMSLDFDVDAVIVEPATFGGALFCGLVGVIFFLVSLNLLNGLALVWRQLATAMLGSSRHALAAPPPPELTGATGSGMPSPATA